MTFNTVSSSPTDYKTVIAECCTNTITVNVIVCEAEVTDIWFDHDNQAQGHNDSLTIYDVTLPEWEKGTRNEPAVYVMDTNDIDIMAGFLLSPAVSGPETTILATSGSLLGDVSEKSDIVFQSGDAYERFSVTGSSAAAIDESTVQWQWKVKDFGHCTAAEFNINTSGPHTIYAIYDTPVCGGSNFTKDNIDEAEEKGHGESTEPEIAFKANGSVAHTIFTEEDENENVHICGDGFQVNFDAAMGRFPAQPPQGQCCCRAVGLDYVLQVLGIGPYTLIYCNEMPESSWATSDHNCSGVCDVHGSVMRLYYAVGSGYNRWEGAIRSGDVGTTAYAPGGGSFEGTHDEIADNWPYDWASYDGELDLWIMCDENCNITYGDCSSHSSYWGRFE